MLGDLLTYLNVHGVEYLGLFFMIMFAISIIVAIKDHWEGKGYSEGYAIGFQKGLEEGDRRSKHR
jgi:hypothetical protein